MDIASIGGVFDVFSVHYKTAQVEVFPDVRIC
jgi:hypothetical protein